MRLFIAIELSDSVTADLFERQCALAAGGIKGKPVSKQQMHLTLHFLGEQGEGALQRVKAAMTAACARQAPFELTLGELGHFKQPRGFLIWQGIDDAEGRLASLYKDLGEQLCHGGFKLEKRAFRPHVTLIRRAEDGGMRSGAHWREPSLPLRFMVTDLTLFESILRSGVQYLPHERIALQCAQGLEEGEK